MNLAAFFKGKKGIVSAYDPNFVTVGSATLYTDQWQAFFFGWTLGLQYNNQTISNCFTTIVDTLDSFDYVKIDYEDLIENYNYYNLIFYDPLHIYSNVMASYE